MSASVSHAVLQTHFCKYLQLLIHRSYRVKWCIVSIEGTTMHGARGAIHGVCMVRCLLGVVFFFLLVQVAVPYLTLVLFLSTSLAL